MIDYSFSEFEADMDDRLSYRGKREKRKRAMFKFRKKLEKRRSKETKPKDNKE